MGEKDCSQFLKRDLEEAVYSIMKKQQIIL
jgi:hypothetical protein